MRRFLLVTLMLAAAWQAATASGRALQQSSGPRRQFEALAREYRAADRRFRAEHEQLKTREEKQKHYAEQRIDPGPYVGQFLKLAESAPDDQAAVDSLIWIVDNGGSRPDVNRAVELLASKYPANKRLGEVAPSLVTPLANSLAASADKLFEAIIAKNPDRVAQGQACMALAEYFEGAARIARSLNDKAQAGLSRFFFRSQGADEASIATASQQNPDELAKRSEVMFARAKGEYVDVRDFVRIVDHKVQAKLWESANLGIGKAAPEIVGEDINGKPLKLSDYKGKVVVLIFWGDWNAPSRAVYPQWQALAKRMEGKPFALLGVNSDKDREKLKQTVKAERIAWRSWWDQGSEAGPISAQFKIPGWPTTYILDHEGAIRSKFLGPPRFSFDVNELIDELTNLTANVAAR
jgi:peroxiredoxin